MKTVTTLQTTSFLTIVVIVLGATTIVEKPYWQAVIIACVACVVGLVSLYILLTALNRYDDRNQAYQLLSMSKRQKQDLIASMSDTLLGTGPLRDTWNMKLQAIPDQNALNHLIGSKYFVAEGDHVGIIRREDHWLIGLTVLLMSERRSY